MLEYFGYFAAVLIGISLGLIGSGGSILTVPVLVYLMGADPVNATAYSLFIVGITSLVGSYFYMKKKLISYKTAVVFAVPAFVTVFFTRLYVLPAIPEIIYNFSSFVLFKRTAIMLFFAILMGLSAYSMIKKNNIDSNNSELSFNYPMIMVEGIVVGLLTGLVGAGGGFLIIPALVLLAKLPMKMAVGTSLLIIAAKSLIGFLGDIGAKTQLDWNILILFSVLAIVGIFIGSLLTKYISNNKLKPAFGWFVLVMSVFIIIREII